MLGEDVSGGKDYWAVAVADASVGGLGKHSTRWDGVLWLARSWDLEEAQGDGPGTGTPPEPVRRASAWLRADLWHEFLGQPTTEFSSASGAVPFTADLDESWVKVGLGGTYDFTNAWTAFANVNYERTFDGDAYAWEGKLGVKVAW